VIAKNAGPTPTPSEILDSPFGKALETRSGAPVRVYHFGEAESLSAYLRALNESRDIYCVSGDLATLGSHLGAGVFPKNPENESVVALPQAGALIVESDSTATGKAPDHLFRLFAYNKILRELNTRAGEEEPADLLRLAEQAYVVTPISSLVTLETKEDYERFGIKKTEGLPSLGNAWTNGAGSVPEPHEWALIALLVISAWLAWRRNGILS
jgi:XrtN system VIT domain protein